MRGLNEFPDAHPPVAPVFFAFRLMVGVGGLMLLVSWVAAWQLHRRDEPGPWVSRALVAMSFSGWVALIAGWYVTEIGRQPWLVTGVLKTADAVAPPTIVAASDIQLTLTMYLLLYAVLLVSFISVLFHLAGKARVSDEPKNMNPTADPFRAEGEKPPKEGRDA